MSRQDKMFRPISEDFLFSEFLNKMRLLEYRGMLHDAQLEARRVFGLSHVVHGAPQARRRGSTDYHEKIGQFLFFLGNRRRPSGLSNRDFKRYLPIAQKLISDGDWSEEVLCVFDGL
jgi:hypothetical protein